MRRFDGAVQFTDIVGFSPLTENFAAVREPVDGSDALANDYPVAGPCRLTQCYPPRSPELARRRGPPADRAGLVPGQRAFRT